MLLLSISGGQNTIMVASFFQGIITSLACIASMWFILYFFGWDNIISTLLFSENILNNGSIGPEWFKQKSDLFICRRYPEIIANLTRPENVSMMNPFKQTVFQTLGHHFL